MKFLRQFIGVILGAVLGLYAIVIPSEIVQWMSGDITAGGSGILMIFTVPGGAFLGAAIGGTFADRGFSGKPPSK